MTMYKINKIIKIIIDIIIQQIGHTQIQGFPVRKLERESPLVAELSGYKKDTEDYNDE